jgi:hypothetical protein
MPTVSTDIDDVVTDNDLVLEAGTIDKLNNIMAVATARRLVLERTLADVLDSLRNRVPPIHEGSLQDVSELKRVVTYGAMADMHRKQITIGGNDDVSANMARMYQKLYESTRDALRPTVSSGQIAAPFGIALHRR